MSLCDHQGTYRGVCVYDSEGGISGEVEITIDGQTVMIRMAFEDGDAATETPIGDFFPLTQDAIALYFDPTIPAHIINSVVSNYVGFRTSNGSQAVMFPSHNENKTGLIAYFQGVGGIFGPAMLLNSKLPPELAEIMRGLELVFAGTVPENTATFKLPRNDNK